MLAFALSSCARPVRPGIRHECSILGGRDAKRASWALGKQEQQATTTTSNNNITGHASESLSEPLIPTHFEPADGDFAEAGHWKRALILLLSCARLVRVQNLVLGTAALRSSEILLGAVPVLQAVAP